MARLIVLDAEIKNEIVYRNNNNGEINYCNKHSKLNMNELIDIHKKIDVILEMLESGKI